MSVTFGIPKAELDKFSRTLHEYSKVNKREFKDIVNAKALDLAHKAFKHTKVADVDKFAWELGQIGTKLTKSKHTGKLYQGKRIFRTDLKSFANRIINARRRKAGKPIIWGDELDKAGRKMVASRIKAKGFIRSGWLAVIKTLSRLSKDPNVRAQARDLDNEKTRGKVKGIAYPANDTLNPVAIIVNTSLKDSPQAQAVAEAGLRKAVSEVTADMQKYIQRKMQPHVDKLNK